MDDNSVTSHYSMLQYKKNIDIYHIALVCENRYGLYMSTETDMANNIFDNFIKKDIFHFHLPICLSGNILLIMSDNY